MKSKTDKTLRKAGEWFSETICQKHLQNTLKLSSASKLDINPMLAPYLSQCLTDEITPEGVARALIYPRVLGTSITTSMGQNIQSFITDVLGNTFGSATEGLDVEYIDVVDKRKKYCQIKLGETLLIRMMLPQFMVIFPRLKGGRKQIRWTLDHSTML